MGKFSVAAAVLCIALTWSCKGRHNACVANHANGTTECWQNVSKDFCMGYSYRDGTTCAAEGFSLQMGPETYIQDEIGSCTYPVGSCADDTTKGDCFFGKRSGGQFSVKRCAERSAK